ncbi:MAG: ABC-type dipeptide/oligopeptide/nickel transport system, permease component, partial [Bacteroidetes bacterium]|nr:ABC-type dipeptide/oligopeptide/nickel transport system, permease component [Bacteroidota bacterium]
MKLVRYIVNRLSWGALVLLFVSFFSFLIIQLPPGDYLSSYMARLEKSGMSVDNQSMVALRHSYGLDQPFLVQYGKWFFRFVQGDMGVSFLYTEKVETIIKERLPATLMLSLSSLLVIY